MLAVIIPAFNEEQSLPLVLRDLKVALSTQKYEIIVCDNGSTDETAALAAGEGARVVPEPVRGYGRACLTALAAISPEAETIAFIDADYSDYPEEILDLLAPIQAGSADFVIGTRNARAAPRSLTPQQKFGNWLATFLVRIIWRHRYSDLGPFRAIRRDALEALRMQDQNFGWTIEMQIRALKAGLKVDEIAVSYRKRIGKSKISGTIKGTFMAGTIILRTIARELFSRQVYVHRST